MSYRNYANAQGIFVWIYGTLLFYCSVILEESDEWETPQISSSAYSSIGYEYQERHSKTVDGDKEYDPNECFDYDDSYQGRLV